VGLTFPRGTCLAPGANALDLGLTPPGYKLSPLRGSKAAFARRVRAVERRQIVASGVSPGDTGHAGTNPSPPSRSAAAGCYLGREPEERSATSTQRSRAAAADHCVGREPEERAVW
jgi:hypothetical protein